MQSEYEISTLYQEAHSRWLKPPEVLFILQNHESLTLTNTAPQRPTSGSLLLFNKRVLKFFRKDGHQWRRKRDGRAIAEAHERLKVGNAEALNCYYAHGEQDPTFRRRIYWMLDPEYEHIVLVHYRDVSEREEGQQTGGQVYQFAPILSTQNVSYNQYIGDSSDIYQQSSTSPGVAEVNSNLEGSASSSEFGQALKMLKEQLSIGDEHVNSVDPHYIQPESLDSLQFLEYSDIDHLAQPTTVYQRPENNKLERCYGGNFGAQYSAKNDSNKLERCYGGYVGGAEYHSSNLMLVKNGSGPSGGTGGSGDQGSESWKDVLEACEASIPLNSEGSTPSSAKGLLAGLQEDSNWSYSNQVDQSTFLLPQDLGSFQLPASYSALVAPENNGEYCGMMEDGMKIGLPFEQEMRVTGAHNQKFTIQDISPDWGYANETTKV